MAQVYGGNLTGKLEGECARKDNLAYTARQQVLLALVKVVAVLPVTLLTVVGK